jgi:hypothetical protein
MRAQQAQLLVTDHAEGMRHVGLQRDGVALLQGHPAVLAALDPGLGGALQDVQDLQVRVRVHGRHVARLGGLDAGPDRRAAGLVPEDRLIVGVGAELHDLGILELTTVGSS